MVKLLVPVDESENALRAVRHAVERAKADPSIELHIVTAHESIFDNPRALAYIDAEKLARAQQQEGERILAQAAEIPRAAGVRFTSEVLTGSIPAVIAARADELGCAGIVMGTRGLGAVGNLLLGSVATKVIHLAKVPVTLVK